MQNRTKLINLIVIAGLIGAGVGLIFENQPSSRLDPVTQQPIAAQPAFSDARVIVQGQFTADFKDLTTTGNIVVNGDAYPVEYADEFGESYVIRNVKLAESGKYDFTEDPAETRFDIEDTVTSKEKEIVPVSSSVQPFITMHGTINEEFFAHSTTGKLFSGIYGGSTLVRGAGNEFTMRASATNAQQVTLAVTPEDQYVMRFPQADQSRLYFPAPLGKVLEVGDIKVAPAE